MQDKELFDKSVKILNDMMGNFLLYTFLCQDDDRRLHDELVCMRDLIDDILDFQFENSEN